MQAVQQEVEGLRRDRPSLTPRPTRDITPLRDLVNNDKVTFPRSSQLGRLVCLSQCLDFTLRQVIASECLFE